MVFAGYKSYQNCMLLKHKSEIYYPYQFNVHFFSSQVSEQSISGNKSYKGSEE